ncbi:MAG: hypothetical protein IJL12_03880 [Selenomonadaceae bacterium]|nr:hypothetical protein [Selenomonadaceae bacterium]MBQ6131459.1 hypothetical protein [Selenomonadaceae bacterium]
MMKIINIFCHNFLKKVIALIAAFFMWVFVMTEQDPEIEDAYTVPLTMSNVPYEFIAICETKNVVVDTRAPRSNFVKYDANAFRVYANLEGLGEGEHQILPQVIMPQGFELLETEPLVVNVKLDPLIERQMPIELITAGEVSPDVAIKEITKSMDTVTVVGPKSFVEKAVKVYGNVNLSNNTASFEQQIQMNAVDEKNNIVPRVRVVPSVITVSVDIESGLKKRIVPVIPELSVAEGWELTKVSVEPAQMEVVGAESVVNSIVTLKTVPFTVQTGQRYFKSVLRLLVPDGVTVKSEEVTVSAEVVRKAVMRD